MVRTPVLGLILAMAGYAPAALAQQAATTQPGLEEEQAQAQSRQPDRLSDAQADVQETARPRSDTDPHEEPNKDYFSIGIFTRGVIIPSFIPGIFLVGPGGGGTISGINPSVGAEFIYRRNNFNIGVQFWWNNASGSGYGRGNGHPDTDMELIESNLGIVFLSTSLMWAFPIVDWFAIELGFDVGFGFVYGNLQRTEAYPTPGVGAGWGTCTAPGMPNGTYCEPPSAGGLYHTQEPNWTSGGSVPNIMPWISLPHLAFRFTPIRQVQIRLDGGYALYGFFFGGSAAFGF